MSHQPRREEYTVGWICALSIEYAAAVAMLDTEHHDPVFEQDEEDIYSLGSIADHNVVIACLPCRPGTNTAAALATRMQAKFKGIRFRLVVGIGGGVPSDRYDIRLGDVVVSTPHHTFAGVVQYDMIKTTPNMVERIGSLDSPPSILLSAVGSLKKDALLRKSKLPSLLSKIQHEPCFQRSEACLDVLYHASYNHETGLDCKNCSPDKQVLRPQRRKGEEVVVHYGTIASGNRVMKSAIDRDNISQQLGGVLCFEMEAAGLMNDFRCIVIRGISDYADSHKNDQWQGYAAGTAAAYAKELLLKIPPAQVRRTPRPDETMRDTRKRNTQSPEANPASSKRRRTEKADSSVLGSEEETTAILQDRTRRPLDKDGPQQLPNAYRSRRLLNEEQKQQLLESLKFEQIDERKNIIKKANPKTCMWLLESKHYLEWVDVTKIKDHHGFLWIKGKAGAGKSTLMKFAMEQAFKGKKDNLILSFFFNARGSTLEKSTIGAYRSLLLNLLIEFPALQDIFDSLYTPTSVFDTNRGWSVESLKTLLGEAIQKLEKVSIVCFIDALDECDETEIRDMIQFFEHVGDLSIEKENTRFLICFSSRHYPHITIRNGIELVLEGQEGHDQDITNYIETELKIGKSKKAQEIRAAVQEKAEGIFMWVVLVVRILNKESDRGRVHQLQQKLREIPSDLHDLFRDILTRDSNNKDELVLCIQWVLFAKQALSPEQLFYAILSGRDPDSLSAWNSEEINQETINLFILDCSKGLTDVTAKNRKVQFIHESVRDFLLKEEGLSKIWPEYKDNFPGQSHERLKQCSICYLTSDVEKILDLSKSFVKKPPQEAKALCLEVKQLFPFLEYAVQNIFYHADMAEAHGISQAMFTKDFQLARWIQLYNVLEIFKTRRYRKNVSLLYVLAELDCANLIRSHLPLSKGLVVGKGRYGCPLLAAYALGNNAAIQVLSSAVEPASTNRDPIHKRVECDEDGNCVQQRDRDFKYWRKRSLMFNASLICPEWLMIRLLGSPIYISDTPLSDIRSILQEACRRDHTAVVEKLLGDHAFLSEGEPSSRDQGLVTAVENGHVSTVKLLVSKEANINIQNRVKENTIHIASTKGFENIAMFLLDTRPDLINSTNDWGETPLILATKELHQSLAEALVLRGADIHSQSNRLGNVLYQASRHGFKSFVIQLLDEGVQLAGQQEGLNYSALEGACLGGHKDVAELLLERGADVNAQGGYYGNALQSACRGGHKDVAELLLERGADVNAQGGYYGNALQSACHEGHKGVVELLLKRGADVNAQGGKYGNALRAACYRGKKDIVELLLERGADVNAQGDKYGNALQAACYIRKKDIVELLLEKGADCNVRSDR